MRRLTTGTLLENATFIKYSVQFFTVRLFSV